MRLEPPRRVSVASPRAPCPLSVLARAEATGGAEARPEEADGRGALTRAQRPPVTVLASRGAARPSSRQKLAFRSGMESTHGWEQDGVSRMGTTAKRVRLVLGLLVAVGVGCGTYAVTPSAPPTLPLPEGAAKICLVRRGADGVLATYPIKDNNILVGATVEGSCFCYFAAGGHHDLEIRTDGFDSLSLDVKAGSEYVLLQRMQSAAGKVRSQMERLDAEKGKAAMGACQYSVLTEVPDGTYHAKPEAVVVAK